VTIIILCLLLAAWAALVAVAGGLDNLARGRKYKSGTSWCVWRWTDVESEYILRLHVVKTPWCAVCLHWIRKPDKEPWLHDHPVSFFSFILRGGYTELRRTDEGKPYHKVNRWFNFVRGRHTDAHRIVLARSNTLTLCFMGPKTREWGFHVWEEMCPEGTATPGWIMWKDYYARLKAGEDMRKSDVFTEFDRVLQTHYTLERVQQKSGLYRGDHVSETETKLVCRECRQTIREDDFTDEDPTKPYGADDVS
jgi:hypothetical protein